MASFSNSQNVVSNEADIFLGSSFGIQLSLIVNEFGFLHVSYLLVEGRATFCFWQQDNVAFPRSFIELCHLRAENRIDYWSTISQISRFTSSRIVRHLLCLNRSMSKNCSTWSWLFYWEYVGIIGRRLVYVLPTNGCRFSIYCSRHVGPFLNFRSVWVDTIRELYSKKCWGSNLCVKITNCLF